MKTTQEATQEFLQSIMNGASLLTIVNRAQNLYGFWLQAKAPEHELKPLIDFLAKMNEISQILYSAKNDDTLQRAEQQRKELEIETGFLVHTAIARLISIVSPIAEEDR